MSRAGCAIPACSVDGPLPPTDETGATRARSTTHFHSTSWAAIGTTATVVVQDVRALECAAREVAAEVAAFDAACSRFDPGSELCRLQADLLLRARVGVGEVLFAALAESLRVAAATGGLVDPTVGTAMALIGYDRDFAAVEPRVAPVLRAGRVPGWRTVSLDPLRRTVSVPPGVCVDLGASGKALCADRSARRAAERSGAAVMVSLGGDISVAGDSPPGGWPVAVAESHLASPVGLPTVTIRSGGIATSSVASRRWRRGDGHAHHIVDPRTGEPSSGRWRTVTVAASSCIDANAASTAALVVGDRGAPWLAQRGLPARLVDHDGLVTTVAGWPVDVEAGQW